MKKSGPVMADTREVSQGHPEKSDSHQFCVDLYNFSLSFNLFHNSSIDFLITPELLT